jgi:hypothetical protein
LHAARQAAGLLSPVTTSQQEGSVTESFAPFAEEFLRFTSEIVWCTATTVDSAGRPRSRVLHPIFEVTDDRPVGWVLTGRTPVKSRHLAANPHVACAYWSPAQNVVYLDCVASWVADNDAETKRYVFDLFATTPPPLGYGPEGVAGYGPDGPASPIFTPLRLDPWRVQILRFEGWTGNLTPRIWRAESG